MKRRLLIALFAAIFLIGIIMVLNRNPGVDVGDVLVTRSGEQTAIEGYEITRVSGDKTKQLNDEPELTDILDKMPSYDQQVKINNGNNSVTMNTDMTVGFKGKYYDVLYTIYDLEGNVLDENVTKLTLPTSDIDGCVVKIEVKWGREKNYIDELYYFRLNYIKDK